MKSAEKNSGRWKPSSAERTLFCLFILLQGLSQNANATDTQNFFESWQRQLRSVHDVLASQLNGTETSRCTCSYHDCGTEPTSDVMSCVESHHDSNLTCAVETCGHAQVSISKSYVRTPVEIAFGSYPDTIKRDICFTNGLEEPLRNLRGSNSQEFAPWSYFGAAETGVYRIWPGTRRKDDPNGSACSPYDPRVRPWWGRAAWKPRKIMILLCLSETMNQPVPDRDYVRWTLANDMIKKFLDTLSENDYVNILTFNMTVKALIPDELLVQANKENIERIKQALNQERANWDYYTVDIAEALERAFDDFIEHQRRQPSIGGNCDNHILLFTDKRDCVKSAVNGCLVRDRYFEPLEGSSPYIANATEEFFEFVDEKHQDLIDDTRNKATLFSFSLSQNANGMMSQLACRLNGVNVDVQRELGNGVTEPLALMRGYFQKAALPIGQDVNERNMLVSDFYTDYSGLGEMNTFTMPVFYKPRLECPPILYGVIGADIPVSAYDENGIEHGKQAFRTAVSNWNDRRTACDPEAVDPSACDLQVIRGSESQCVFRVNSDPGIRCYRYDDHYYAVNSNPRGDFVRLELAIDRCTATDGELIAPRTDRERRFLSAIIPADGVWIHLTPENNGWSWPDGEVLDREQAEKLRRFRFERLDQVVFMDPKSFDDNFESVQASSMKFYVCKYDNTPSEEICNDENTRTITDDDFNNTLSTCGMEDCLFSKASALAYSRMEERDVVCNVGVPNADYNDLACCPENELKDVCSLGGSSESGDDYVAFVVICVVIAALVLFSCIGVYIYRHSSFSFPFFEDPSKRSQLLNRPIEMRVQMTNPYTVDTSGSPFNREAAGVVDGKRPELVVNIEVKLLDNGWEKVGGYGRVRQGEYMDSSGNVHKVAVKFVDALAPNAAWEALKNEFDILASIPMHPNIVRPIGAHWGDRSAKSERYIVEELMHSNLGDLLHGDSSSTYPNLHLAYKHAVNIFIDIAAGLEHLHKHKIIHFDLKPKNVLLDENLRAKIADFGCSKAKFDTYIALSQMGGTPPYMPPECWMLQYSQGSRTEVARAKIDVYSFGVVMWETLNGGHSIGSVCSQTNVPSTSSPPEEEAKGDANSSDVMVQRWEIKYQLNHSVPAELRDLVNRCIRADFNIRPSCNEILDALRTMLDADWSDKHISFG